MTPEEFEEGIRNAMKLPDEECLLEIRKLVRRIPETYDEELKVRCLDMMPYSKAFKEVTKKYAKDLIAGKYDALLDRDRQPQPKTS